MCDYFLQRMEGDHHQQQAGDLTDVVRAGGAMHQAAVAELSSTATGWQLPAEPAPGGAGLFAPPQPSSSDGAGPSGDAFADPFAGLPDPFASDFRASSSSGAPADFFDFEAPAAAGGARRGGGGVLVDSGGGGVAERGAQMPVLSPREIRPYPVMMGGDTVKIGVPTMMPGLAVGPPCAFDAIAGMQMPSPHGGGIKRRFGTTRDRCQI